MQANSKKPSRLRQKRLLQGKTLKDMAKITNLAIATLAYIEKGRQPTTLETAKKVAKAYKAKLSDINYINVKPKGPK